MARRRITSAFVVYGVLALVAVSVLVLAERPLGQHPSPWLDQSLAIRIGVSIVLGLVLAAIGVVSARILVHRTRWARDLHVGFRELLGPMSGSEIAVFALTSGVAEELFFRAALQPWMGLVLASLVFGGVHLGPRRVFLPWTLWAVVMGFALGATYALTGEVLGCILAHVLINYENLHFINSHDPTATDASASRSGANGLVGDRKRGGGSRSWH